MTLLTQHWSYDPSLILVLGIATIHEVGVRRLNRRASRDRVHRRRGRALWFYLGLAVLLVAVESPIDYWSDSYFWAHMLQHLLLIFAAPVPIALGAPWQPLQHGLPGRLRRAVVRAVARGPTTLRRGLAALHSSWFAVVGLNVVVILWHLPGPFDLAEQNETVHVWLMHSSFFAFGVLFWLQLIDSPPLRIRLSPPGQMVAIFSTATAFWSLAMALSIFSSGSWYGWYQAHEGPTLSAFADQQIGAGLMWTCGTCWAVPAMIVAARRLMDRSGGRGIEAAFDAAFGRRLGRRPGPVHRQVAHDGAMPAKPPRSVTTTTTTTPPRQRSTAPMPRGP